MNALSKVGMSAEEIRQACSKYGSGPAISSQDSTPEEIENAIRCWAEKAKPGDQIDCNKLGVSQKKASAPFRSAIRSKLVRMVSAGRPKIGIPALYERI